MRRRDNKKSLERVSRGLRDFVSLKTVKLAEAVIANLTAAPSRGGTPVDTGWARSNWIPNIGGPLRSSGKRDKNARYRVKKYLGEGTVAGQTYKVAKGKVYISNSVPYIVFLNEGSSKQAPAGFVQAAIRRAVASNPRV